MLRVTCAVAVAATALSTIAAPALACAPQPAHSVRADAVLAGGTTLVSPNGRFTARITPQGRLRVLRGTSIIWHSKGPHAHNARLRLRPGGNLTLRAGPRLLWTSRTAGSHATKLALTDKGALVLRSAGGTVWSSRVGNRCHSGAGKRVVIDLGTQFAKLCKGSQQVLTTPITSGATALGDATPTGTWRLQAKQRDTYLYPAAGGAYFVHYWMPYDGVYGMHDSSWQKFPYGSPKYRTRGSHGCVHFPKAAIKWMYAWARVGTTVRIGA